MPRSRSRSPRNWRRRSPPGSFRGKHQADDKPRSDTYRSNCEDRLNKYNSRSDRPSNHRRNDRNDDRKSNSFKDKRSREEFRSRDKKYNNNQRHERKNVKDEEKVTGNGFTFDDPATVPRGMFYEHDRRDNYAGTGGSHSFFKAQDRKYSHSDRQNYSHKGSYHDQKATSSTAKVDYYGYRTDPLESTKRYGFVHNGQARNSRQPAGNVSHKRPESPTVWKHDKFEQLEKEARGPSQPEDVSD